METGRGIGNHSKETVQIAEKEGTQTNIDRNEEMTKTSP